MSDLERLLEIARALPPRKVHALLTAAEKMMGYVLDDEFLRSINSAPPLDLDEDTAMELRAALAERGETISHDELKQQLGLRTLRRVSTSESCHSPPGCQAPPNRQSLCDQTNISFNYNTSDLSKPPTSWSGPKMN